MLRNADCAYLLLVAQASCVGRSVRDIVVVVGVLSVDWQSADAFQRLRSDTSSLLGVDFALPPPSTAKCF